jgi:hypothetical protein
MEAKELRIGNKVLNVKGEVDSIKEIWEKNNDYAVVLENEHNAYYLTHKGGELIKPIPLTEEWLLRFGFESYDVEYKYASRWLNIEKSENGYVKLADDYFIDSFEFKHVHQLQNLYFALSNEELILNQ